MYVKFVKGGEYEKHYLNWAKIYEVDLDKPFKVLGEFVEGKNYYWKCEPHGNPKAFRSIDAVHLTKDSFQPVFPKKTA